MNSLYPVFLRLDSLRCVVIGGGKVAARKIRGLLECGARVDLIAPAVCDELEAMLADARISWKNRQAEPGDVKHADLVFLATSDPEVNESFARLAMTSGALVNQADSNQAGSFQLPATVRHGDIAVAVSTGGRSPVFAQLLRDEIEQALSPERLELLEVIAEARLVIKGSGESVSGDAWRAAANNEILNLVRRGARGEAVQRLVDSVRSPAATGSAQ